MDTASGLPTIGRIHISNPWLVCVTKASVRPSRDQLLARLGLSRKELLCFRTTIRSLPVKIPAATVVINHASAVRRPFRLPVVPGAEGESAANSAAQVIHPEILMTVGTQDPGHGALSVR